MLNGPVLACALITLLSPRGAQPAQGGDREKEEFLLQGVVVDTGQPPGGTSRSVKATLRLDGIEHAAMVHTIDEWKASFQLLDRAEFDFRDSYRNNIAAYRLDRLLGLGMVPVTVPRSYRGRSASFMWWVDNVMMDEAERLKRGIRPPDPTGWTRQIYVTRIFDQLIYNFDRNTTNLLIDEQWRVWMIDHTRSFKVFGELREPENLGTRCERGMLAAMRGLDTPLLEKTMGDLLSPDQVKGLLQRRDLIVAHYDELIDARGEIVVLFDLPSRTE